jgi:phosphatidylethanolamine/phosphatidyl-N-methylethanolamine N-methyltransferase
MTIVIQHWYDALDVTDDGFSITLNFGDSPERLRVPFDAILTFVDPSVEFGLRFETAPAPDGPSDDDDPIPFPTPMTRPPTRTIPPPRRMPRWSASTRSAANTDIDTRQGRRLALFCGPKRRLRRGTHITRFSAMSQSDFALFMGQMVRRPHQVVGLPLPPGSSAPKWWPVSTRMAGPVIELGAGTGNITAAILGHGIAPEHASFHRDEPGVLRPPARPVPPAQRPPDERGRRGRPAGRGRAGRYLGPAAPVDAADLQHAILGGTFRRVRPGGTYVQFTYGPKPPVARPVREELGLTWRGVAQDLAEPAARPRLPFHARPG